MSHLLRYIISPARIAALALLLLVAALPAQALSPETYTRQSALAEGRWVRVRVSQSGLHILSPSALRSMGFSDPARVRIHGYGGARIDDILSAERYIDDLPETPQQLTDRGIVFYAQGPDTWERYSSTSFYHKAFNPYSNYGYYYLTESDSTALAVDTPTGIAGDAAAASKRARGRAHYEQDLVQATEAGHLMVGEEFRFTPSRTFDIATPGRIPGHEVGLECQFVAAHVGVQSLLEFKVDGQPLEFNASDRIAAKTDNHYVHATLVTTRHNFTPADGDKGGRMSVNISHSSNGIVTKANLDYLTLNYDIDLEIPTDGLLEFWSSIQTLSLGGISDDTRLWDVTDPAKPLSVNFSTTDGRAVWKPSYNTMRSYVAWRPGVNLPEPEFDARISNQNLHADGGDIDMVIFTTAALANQARRIARLHEDIDSMHVRVVDIAQVYHEFSSGAPDVSGLRKYLKMLYDRGALAGHPLKYALLLGRTTLDHRNLLASTRSLGYQTIPAWVNRVDRESMSDNDGLSTDDFIAILGDNSGADLGLDDLSIAVGRIPMTSDADGAEIVDKLYQYVNSAKRSNWKNRILVLADDEDQGIHLRQAEAMSKLFEATPQQQHLIDRVYLDAYTKSNGEYPEARSQMFRALDEGVAWWFYTGHANNHAWTADGQLTFTDINNMYLRNLPFLVAATCDFLRWDSETTSGGEIMYKERYGGVIGMLSATRPVYISDNGYFLEALGRHVLQRDDRGRLLTPGEIYRRAKNDILNSQGQHRSNPNRLRFVFMGDPAMPLVTPHNIVELLTIDGRPVDLDDQLTLAAMADVEITGRITDPAGQLLSDFNGTVYIDLYDALTSVTTFGNGNGKVEVFDRRGDKLFAGSATVADGLFTAHIAMPSMVADNFRPATISMYAAADNSADEAIGTNSDFYVYGFQEPAVPDTIAPVIEAMYLNHDGFTDGAPVNSAPMLIAAVRDNVGINLSVAGVGHQMTIMLDGNRPLTDVSSFYTPSADGSPSGTINYPLENLAEGAHTLTLRVFDTSGNLAERTIDFLVDDNIAPQIFDVFTDASPASESASFYVRHDRPETILSVTVTVYDLLGHPVWEGTTKGLSDSNISAPVVWDLTDRAGHRVPRSIYIYRASITTDNAHYETASRRLAVTGN